MFVICHFQGTNSNFVLSKLWRNCKCPKLITWNVSVIRCILLSTCQWIFVCTISEYMLTTNNFVFIFQVSLINNLRWRINNICVCTLKYIDGCSYMFSAPLCHVAAELFKCRRQLFFLIAYFTPDVIGEPLTNREIPYVKVFGICPTLRGVGANLRNASVTFSLILHKASLGWH